MRWLKQKSKVWRVLGLSVITLVLATACLLINHKAITYGATNGLIVFARNNGTADDIYTMQSDGSNIQQLTTGSDDYNSPVWSPDGTKIAFVDTSGSTDQIYIMNADGSDPVNTSNNGVNNDDPTWSPDGTKIAYTNNNQDISVMTSTGSNQHTIVSNTNPSYAPSWSPNGNTIAFVCNQGTYDQICTANSVGSSQVQITSDNADHDYPAWSPDGTKLVYVYAASRYVDQLAINNADGSNQQVITTSADNVYTPSWSPDGTKIIYSNNLSADTNARIYTIDTDGSGETAISPNDGEFAWAPSWQAVQSTQSNITTIVNPVNGENTVVQSSCTSNSSVSAAAAPSNYQDSGLNYPDGLVSFMTNCGTPSATATISITFYGLAYSGALTLRKYNATTHTYQTIPGATITSVTIGGQQATKVTYQITDGGPYDQDGTANGTIVDPVGLAVPDATLTDTGINVAKAGIIAAGLIGLAFIVRRTQHTAKKV